MVVRQRDCAVRPAVPRVALTSLGQQDDDATDDRDGESHRTTHTAFQQCTSMRTRRALLAHNRAFRTRKSSVSALPALWLANGTHGWPQRRETTRPASALNPPILSSHTQAFPTVGIQSHLLLPAGPSQNSNPHARQASCHTRRAHPRRHALLPTGIALHCFFAATHPRPLSSAPYTNTPARPRCHSRVSFSLSS